jgi:hypothetical protein
MWLLLRTAPTLVHNNYFHKALNALHRQLLVYVPTKQNLLNPWLQYMTTIGNQPFKDKAQTALFKDPVRTAL